MELVTLKPDRRCQLTRCKRRYAFLQITVCVSVYKLLVQSNVSRLCLHKQRIIYTAESRVWGSWFVSTLFNDCVSYSEFHKPLVSKRKLYFLNFLGAKSYGTDLNLRNKTCSIEEKKVKLLHYLLMPLRRL
jgi:hypothetical protein